MICCTCDESCPIHGSRTLKVERRLPYGRTRFFPKNVLSAEFAHLLRQSSFTEEDLVRLKKLGYLIETESEVL